MAALWQFYLADTLTMTPMGEITDDLRNKSFDLGVNRIGSFSFNIKMASAWAPYVLPESTCIIARKNKVTVWSGPVWTKQETFDNGDISCSASGWFQFLHNRSLVDGDHTFTATTDGSIGFALLNYANSQTVDGAAQPTLITAGSNGSSSTRTQTFDRWQNIGEAIEGLTEQEAGFDFDINPVTRVMNIYAWNDFLDNTEATFFSNSLADNAEAVVRSSSAEEMGNQYYVVGQDAIAEAHSNSSLATHQLSQKVITITETTDLGVLAAVANAELAVNQEPRVVIEFSPKANQDAYPSFFEDYNLRDKVYLTAKRDYALIEDQAIRVFGISFSIDEFGNEKISKLQTTYQNA